MRMRQPPTKFVKKSEGYIEQYELCETTYVSNDQFEYLQTYEFVDKLS